eukprot:758439-Hanusia_phi.AAC.4
MKLLKNNDDGGVFECGVCSLLLRFPPIHHIKHSCSIYEIQRRYLVQISSSVHLTLRKKRCLKLLVQRYPPPTDNRIDKLFAPLFYHHYPTVKYYPPYLEDSIATQTGRTKRGEEGREEHGWLGRQDDRETGSSDG